MGLILKADVSQWMMLVSRLQTVADKKTTGCCKKKYIGGEATQRHTEQNGVVAKLVQEAGADVHVVEASVADPLLEQ